MQVEIARYLLSFGETTIVLFIYIRFIALHLKVIFYSNHYKYIVWLEMSTRKYASRYENLKRKKKRKKKRRKINLEYFLKHDAYYDIDDLDLLSKLKVLKGILQIKEYTPIDILNYIKMLDSFPNTCITYWILLTIPITIASTKRRFSKLKIIKSYLRSTMS